jgi:glucose/mannose-6-phosphate isomerase
LNQNAKQLAWAGCYPEFNHAEMISWTKQPMQKPYKVVELRSSLEHQRTLQRFAITERLLSGLRPSPLIVAPHGDTLLYQQLWAMLLGDFVSVYIALLSGINPMPQKLMETFNQEMEHSL